MLKKALRLPAQTSFLNAKSIHTEYATIKFQKNDLDLSRFGFIVSKRISKSAVIRNSIKRRIRNCFEKNVKAIKPGYDMLLIVRKNIPADEDVNCSLILSTLSNKLI